MFNNRKEPFMKLNFIEKLTEDKYSKLDNDTFKNEYNFTVPQGALKLDGKTAGLKVDKERLELYIHSITAK